MKALGVGRGIAVLFLVPRHSRWGWGFSPMLRPPLPPKKTRYPLYSKLGGSQGRSRRAENLVPTGIRSRTVQPVVSRYTNWATGPTLFAYTNIVTFTFCDYALAKIDDIYRICCIVIHFYSSCNIEWSLLRIHLRLDIAQTLTILWFYFSPNTAFRELSYFGHHVYIFLLSYGFRESCFRSLDFDVWRRSVMTYMWNKISSAVDK